MILNLANRRLLQEPHFSVRAYNIAKPFDLEHLEKVLSWNLRLNK